MSAFDAGANDPVVEIRIVLDQLEPPVGQVRLLVGGAESASRAPAAGLGFTGWLGLLRALSEVMAGPRPDAGEPCAEPPD